MGVRSCLLVPNHYKRKYYPQVLLLRSTDLALLAPYLFSGYPVLASTGPCSTHNPAGHLVRSDGRKDSHELDFELETPREGFYRLRLIFHLSTFDVKGITLMAGRDPALQVHGWENGNWNEKALNYPELLDHCVGHIIILECHH